MIDGEVVAFDGRAHELRRAGSARAAARAGLPLRVRRALAGRLSTCGPLPLRSRKRLLRAALDLQGPGAPHAAPQPRRRGVLRGGLPQGVGGADRQAGGQPVLHVALARLAQVQVRPGPGARDRRVHRRPRARARSSARCCSGTSTATGSSTPARSAPASTGPTLADLGERLGAAAPRLAAVRRRRRHQGARRDVGRAASWSPRWASPSGPGTGACAIRASSACASTSPRGRWCARDDRDASASAAAT